MVRACNRLHSVVERRLPRWPGIPRSFLRPSRSHRVSCASEHQRSAIPMILSIGKRPSSPPRRETGAVMRGGTHRKSAPLRRRTAKPALAHCKGPVSFVVDWDAGSSSDAGACRSATAPSRRTSRCPARTRPGCGPAPTRCPRSRRSRRHGCGQPGRTGRSAARRG